MRIFTPAVALAVILISVPATAGIVIDTRPGAGVESIDTSIWVGQTFTAPIFDLDLFGFEIEDTGTDDLVIIGELYATAGGVPTGAPLFSSAPLAIGVKGTYSFVANLTLVPGSVYAIVPDVTAGAGEVWGTGLDIYAGGSTINSANGGGTWFTAPGADTAVLVVFSPEPSSVLLLGLGLATLAGAVRRRRRRA